MKIGVVGSGISGLSAAYYLSKKHQVDLFEKEDHFGGHSHTIDLLIEDKKISVQDPSKLLAEFFNGVLIKHDEAYAYDS